MPPLPADFIHARACKLKCEKILTRPRGVEYAEELDDETGVGSFYLHVKQKKDQTAKVTIDGEFSA